MTKFLREALKNPDQAFSVYVSIFIALSASLALIFLVSFFSIGIGDGYFSEEICTSRECQKSFTEAFAIPFLILEYGLKSLGAMIALGGLIVAIGGYVANYRLACTQIHHQSILEFKNFISKKIEGNKFLVKECVDPDTWYFYALPNSQLGELTPSQNYEETIDKINTLIEKTNVAITKFRDNYRHWHYLSQLKEELEKIGIKIHDIDRYELYTLEKEAFTLINNVNTIFFPCLHNKKIKNSKFSEIPWKKNTTPKQEKIKNPKIKNT